MVSDFVIRTSDLFRVSCFESWISSRLALSPRLSTLNPFPSLDSGPSTLDCLCASCFGFRPVGLVPSVSPPSALRSPPSTLRFSAPLDSSPALGLSGNGSGFRACRRSFPNSSPRASRLFRMSPHSYTRQRYVRRQRRQSRDGALPTHVRPPDGLGRDERVPHEGIREVVPPSSVDPTV
jgi:hypothetical protein